MNSNAAKAPEALSVETEKVAQLKKLAEVMPLVDLYASQSVDERNNLNDLFKGVTGGIARLSDPETATPKAEKVMHARKVLQQYAMLYPYLHTATSLANDNYILSETLNQAGQKPDEASPELKALRAKYQNTDLFAPQTITYVNRVAERLTMLKNEFDKNIEVIASNLNSDGSPESVTGITFYLEASKPGSLSLAAFQTFKSGDADPGESTPFMRKYNQFLADKSSDPKIGQDLLAAIDAEVLPYNKFKDKSIMKQALQDRLSSPESSNKIPQKAEGQNVTANSIQPSRMRRLLNRIWSGSGQKAA